MEGVTDPAEEYFKDGLWAWDPAAEEWLKLIVDPLTNHLMVDPGDDFEVHQYTAADLRVAAHGYDGSAWQRLGLLWGYSDRWGEYLGETKSGDGQYSRTTAVVPPGYVYVVQAAYIKNETAARGPMYFRAYDGGIYHPVVGVLAPAQNQIVTLSGPFVLKAGDAMNLAQDSCLNNDTMVAGVWGYKMKVT